jgi:hypothetical protein
MNKFLDAYDLPSLSQEDVNHLNKSMTSNKIASVIMNPQTKKSRGPEGFIAEF